MRYIILCIFLALTTCLYADEPKSKAIRKYDNEVGVLRKQGQAAIKRLEGVFEKEVEKLREKTLKDLQKELDAALESKDLDKAVTLREAIKAFEDGDESGLSSKSNAEGKAAPASKKKIKKRIPRDAVGFKGHRYLLVKDNVSWHYAKSQANQLGGHLLRLDSIIEHDFIITYLSSFKPSYKHVHIDGNREFDLKIWRYEDGTPVDFTKVRRGTAFTPSGPILTGGRENYVHSCLYEGGGWSVGCLNPSDLGNYIIEWDN